MYGYRTVVRCRSSGYRVIIVVIEWYCAVIVFMSSGYRAVIVYRLVIVYRAVIVCRAVIGYLTS